MRTLPTRAPIRIPLLQTRRCSSPESRRFEHALDRLARAYAPGSKLTPRTPADRALDLPRALAWPPVAAARALALTDRTLSRRLAIAARACRHNLDLFTAEHLPRGPLPTADFIDTERALLMLRLLRRAGDRDQADTLDDKERFADHFAAADLPLAPLLARFSRDTHPERVPEPACSHIFVKSSRQIGGRGASAWSRAAASRWTDGSLALPWPALVQRLQSLLPARSTALVYERQFNHPLVADLSIQSLNTCRLITLRDPDRPDAPAVLLPLGAYRMGADDRVVDNASQGGLFSAIDADGRLGPALRVGDPAAHATHPTTGARIAGRTLPDFQTARDLAITAHATLPAVITVGWDIALTPKGPVLIEANTYWNPCVQAINAVGLGATALAPLATRIIREHLAPRRRATARPPARVGGLARSQPA